MLVLIIDDNAKLRAATALFLESCGYDVVTVDRVAAALARFDAGFRPHVMLVDLLLPEMDGFQFHEYQMKRQDLQDIPVVFWSGYCFDPAQLRRLDGAPVLQKPANPKTLLEAIETLLKQAVPPPES